MISKRAEKDKGKIDGGVAEDVNYDELNKKQLEKGIEVEYEHTDDKDIAKEIAADHLAEQLEGGKEKEDQDYYDLLKKHVDKHSELISTLIKIANKLDKVGEFELANEIDEIIKSSEKKQKRPPKKWWDKKVKEISESNPDYTEEQISATIGKIWYENLSDSEREKILKKKK